MHDSTKIRFFSFSLPKKEELLACNLFVDHLLQGQIPKAYPLRF